MYTKKTIRIGNTSSLKKKRLVNTSAGCYLVRKKENDIELLVIKKKWADGTRRYVLPKGHKEVDETLEEAALRETSEESGYTDIKLLNYLGSSTYELDWEEIRIKTDHYFLAVLKSNKMDAKKPETYEKGVIVKNQWTSLEKALELLTFENNPEIHEALRAYVEKEGFQRLS